VNRPLQFLAFAGAATVVVVALMVGVLWGFGLLDPPEDEIEAHPVQLLSQTDRVDLGALLAPERPQAPKPPPPPVEPLEIPERQVSGFVQIEVETDAAGRVTRADVVNALPAGVFEEQALRQVQQRRYPPREGGGRYVEVVPFRVSPDRVPPQP
jgi:TonB family protein